MKIISIKLPVSMIEYIDKVASEAGTSRSDFIRHAIRFCIQNRACIETYLPSIGLEEERKKRSREAKDVKVYSFD
jgi:Arc/MetJ-type ribon-helix-helix transcriptional regulator